jgi:outer membrane cobalamin receptor
MRRSSLLVLPFLSLPLLDACAHGAARHPAIIQTQSGEQIITAEAIARSGAHTAWEVLKRAAPHYHLRENSRGEPTRMWRRGRSSLVLNEAPLIYLDGVRVPDLRALQLIAASSIEQISILGGIDGTTYYGTNAAAGVIRIRTKTA